MLSKLSLLTVLGLTVGTLPVLAGPAAKAPAPVAPPVETPLGLTLGVGYDSDYVFRGLETTKNLVRASLDYTHPLSDVFSLNLNAWYGSGAGDQTVAWAGGGSYEELDLSASLLAKVGSFTVGVKYTRFDYFGNASDFVEDVNEVGIVLGTSVAGFDLGFYGAYDDATEGYYFEYTVSRKIQITDSISLVPGVLVSHTSDYYDVDGGNNVLLSLSLPIKLTKTATLTPYIAGNLPFDSLEQTGESSRVFGGVSLSVSF